MTRKHQLYDEIGVAPDASIEEIRKAYHRKAKKTHPDVGGDAREFSRLSRAMAVLSDPKKRARYDQSGDADAAGKPDNKTSEALAIIDAIVGGFVTEFLQTEDPACDPRKSNLLKKVEMKLCEQIEQAKSNLGAAKKYVAFFEDYASRFETTDLENFLRRQAERQIEAQKNSIRDQKSAIEKREHALEILKRYTFRADVSPVSHPFNTFASQSSWFGNPFDPFAQSSNQR